MGTNSGTRRRKRTFSLYFYHCKIEIDYLYGLCCHGWYCYWAQHSLCWPMRTQAAVRRMAQHELCRLLHSHLWPYQPPQRRPPGADHTVVNSYNNRQLWKYRDRNLPSCHDQVLLVLNEFHPHKKPECWILKFNSKATWECPQVPG